MVLLKPSKLQSMRAVTEDTIFTASATTYKGASLHKNCAIRQHDAHMTTYTQRATLYYLHLHLRDYMNYILFHIYAVFSYRTSHTPVLFRYSPIYEQEGCNL